MRDGSRCCLYQDVMRDDTRADDTETGAPVRGLLFAPDGRIGSTTWLIEDVLPEEDEGEHIEQARQGLGWARVPRCEAHPFPG